MVQAKNSLRPQTEAPTEDHTQTQGEEKIELTNYVKAYRAGGKAWLDTVVEKKETAYDTLYDKLQQLGSPHIQKFDEQIANRSAIALRIGQAGS